jgi:hypothetical protein
MVRRRIQIIGRSLFSEWFIFVLPFIRFLGKLDQRMGNG